MTAFRIDFDAMPWMESGGGFRYKAFACHVEGVARSRLRLVEYFKEMEPHWCNKNHMGYVLDGEMEIEVGGECLHFGPGDGVFLPEGDRFKHRAKVLTDVVRVVFVEDV